MSKIYLIKEDCGYYKIGFTKNKVQSRVYQLQTGNSDNFEIIEVFETKHNRKIETTLHNRYKHKRVAREFFNLDQSEVNSFISMCNTIEKGYDAIRELNNTFY